MKSPFSFLVVLLTFSTLTISAQTVQQPDPKSREYLLSFADKVDHNWIWFRKGSNISAKTFFQVYGSNLGLREFDEMRLKRTWEAFGIKYYAYQQFHKQVEVENAEYILHEDKDGHLEVARGYIASNINLPSVPFLRENDALEAALDPKVKYAWQDATWEEELKKREKSNGATYKPTGKLRFSNTAPYSEYPTFDQLELTYVFEAVSIAPFDNRRIVVSAISGKKLSDVSTISSQKKRKNNETGTTTVSPTQANFLFPDTQINFTPYYSRYGSTNTFVGKQEYSLGGSGDVILGFSLKDEARNIIGVAAQNPQLFNPVIREFPLSQTLSGVNWAHYDSGITMGYWSAQKSYDFYKYIFSRNGMNGSNPPLAVIGDDPASNNNASYGRVGVYDFLRFGNGVTGPTCSLDVVGHEFTHGVIRHTSGLGATHIPGAINEGFSDVMGLCIEKYTTGANNWVIGEDWWPGGFRSFSNPNITGNPAVVGDAFWQDPNGCVPMDLNDQCGVHRNATIISRWFGMVATSSVGFDDARSVAYYTMIGLPSNANLMDVRNLSAQVARNMTFYPCSSLESIVVLKWSEVGVGFGDCQVGGGRVASAESKSEADADLIVSPNPAKEYLKITVGEKHAGNHSKEFTLFSSSGVKISERISTSNSEAFQLDGIQDKFVIARVATTSVTGAPVVLQKRVVLIK